MKKLILIIFMLFIVSNLLKSDCPNACDLGYTNGLCCIDKRTGEQNCYFGRSAVVILDDPNYDCGF